MEVGDEDVNCCARGVGAMYKNGRDMVLDGVVSAGNLFVPALPVCDCGVVHQVDGCGWCCHVWFLGDALQECCLRVGVGLCSDRYEGRISDPLCFGE